jgi:mono/diheme cytochrome c family protein/glucose/arabinose dehydrogenase
MMDWRKTHRLALLAGMILVLSGAACAGPSALASDDDDEPEFRPGLIARYTGSDGKTHTRLDAQVAFVWDDRSPDSRVPPGPFQSLWRGQVFCQVAGSYRFSIYAAGHVQLVLDGKVLLDAEAPEPAWLESEPVACEFGQHPIELSYRNTTKTARIGLYWTGPQFQREPLSERWLSHPAKETPSDRFAQGQLLVHALRCAACHALPGAGTPLPAPALDRLSGNISPDWLIDWLASRASQSAASKSTAPAEAVSADPAPAEPSASEQLVRRMPHLGLTAAEARDVAAYLLAKSNSTGKSELVVSPLTNVGDSAAGAVLFDTVGCLACHRVGELGTSGPFGGGDLTKIAAKRPADFFQRWLADPAAINRHHRMPVFRLDDAERANLAAYLNTLTSDSAKSAASPLDSPDASRVEKLIQTQRCGACHSLPGQNDNAADAATLAIPTKLALPPNRNWERSCLGQPDPARRRPGYHLSDEQRLAIVAYVDEMTAVGRLAQTPAAASPLPDGSLVIAERNCLACHARGMSPGISQQVLATVEARPDLRDRLGGMSPPALHGIGDKLHDAALAAAITTATGSRRPWLTIRMPRFGLSDAELAALLKTFIDTDRIPDLPVGPTAKETKEDDPIKTRVAGSRLVTAEGFGCTSCHQIGKWDPQKVALNARGPDLVMLGARLRRPWYDRWVRNPARIVPRMEMPAVQIPIKNVLKNNVDAQLSAVWLALNQPGFNPPRPDALRVVRATGLPGDDRAAVLTDNIDVDGKPWLRPLVIGLPNRHNLMFDLATSRLTHWWTGDTARQRTRGKAWYWESAGTQLLPAAKDSPEATEPELSLSVDGKPCELIPAGQFATEFDSFQHDKRSLSFTQRLEFKTPTGLVTLRVSQSFTALPQENDGPRTGFVRGWAIRGIPRSGVVQLRPVPPTDAVTNLTEHDVGITGPAGDVHLSVGPRGTVQYDRKSSEIALTFNPAPTGGSEYCLINYTTDKPIEPFTPNNVVDRSSTKATLDVVPGFEAVRLPVTDEAMPTGLAWRSDGTLVVSSLEGRVWLGHDTDSDSLVDRLVPFSDNLAAPYGVATYPVGSLNGVGNRDAIDVINKYGLLRLKDLNNDGRADRTETLASGWGYTLDYHDWAVGLPSDDQGNYFVALPCQQDDRSEVEAKLRGSVIKLTPNKPTPLEPHRYSIKPICAGLRFPMGLARSAAGELFATDNQGNYTPFNELNHLVPGARYGFINRLESKLGLNPPFVPAAIEIPHPWTRSVNGICFLETPAKLREKLGGPRFGPFEGHLLGCEFDSRRLVRMSLERVAGTYQGAVYPLSIEPAPAAETFEGPVVCQVAPDGDIYIGNLRDSGWGAGANTGSLVRMRWLDQLPAGIAEVRACPGGFTLDFTGEVDLDLAADAANYSVSSLRRIPTPAYGGPDQDRRTDKIKSVAVSPDRRRVTLQLDSLRPGFVYEFRLRSLVGGARFFPDEAYYTLRKLAP